MLIQAQSFSPEDAFRYCFAILHVLPLTNLEAAIFNLVRRNAAMSVDVMLDFFHHLPRLQCPLHHPLQRLLPPPC